MAIKILSYLSAVSRQPSRHAVACVIIAVLLLTTSCTSLLTGLVINPAIGNLQKQKDVELVCDGTASYLLMIDSLIESDPDSQALLLTGTKAYSGSIAALDACGTSPERLAVLADKAKAYGKRLLSHYLPVAEASRPIFEETLARLQANQADEIFWGTLGWLTKVTRDGGSPASMADLIYIEKIMARLLELDESVEYGGPHLFFGALYGSKPPLLGGDPEKSRRHFERALELSNRMFLLIQTTYAETYARMVFNRQLHDALLNEVLDFPLEQAPDLALSNQIAKRKARQLLDENYFGE